MLPEEAIKEYKILYEKRFGVELTDEEAAFRANNLLTLYKVVYGELSSYAYETDKDEEEN